MALEVGRLVARLELKDDLSAGLGRAKTQMGATAAKAKEMDTAVGNAGKTGSRLAVSGQAAKQLNETTSMAQKLDGQLGKVGLSLGALGTMAGIGGLAAGMSAVITQGNELTNNLNTLRAAGAATDAQMAQISDTAKQLGADNTIVGASAGSAAAAMTELVKGGMSVDQTMQAARGTLQLAAAAQIEAAQAATIQSAALQAFSLSAGDAGRVSDILANAANASSAEIGDVAAAMQQSGTVAHQFGVDIDDTATAIAMFANAGIKGSDAGTLLKTALLALTDQGKPAQGAIEELGLSVYDLEGKFVGLPSLFEQLAAAQSKMSPEAYQAATATLFGADAMRMAGIAAQHGSDGFNTLNEAINRQGGAADMAAAKTRGLPGAINNLQNQAETAAVSLYELVDGPLASLATFTADGIAKVPGALEGIVDAAAPVASAVGSAFSAIPGEVSGALAALVALRVTGLGGALTDRITSTGGALSGLGQSIALQSMYAKDSIAANGVMGASMQGVGKMAGGMKSALGGVVNMLGGPWMIGLVAAGAVVMDFVGAAKSASEVNEKFATASADSAAAQTDLAMAIAATNGEMNDQASAAAQRMVQAEFDKTTAKAEQNHNMLADLDSAVNRISYDYTDFADRVETGGSAMVRSAAATEMAKLEQQALGDATKAAGISMDDVNKVVAEGGGEYYKLRAALADTGAAGEAVAQRMMGVRNEIESTKQAVQDAEPGSYQLAEAFRAIADEASTVEERTNAMRSALDALTGGQKSAEDAAQSHNEKITQIADATNQAWDATKGFGDELIKNGNQIDTTSANGQKLRDSINGIIDTTLQAAASGSDMNAVWASNEQALLDLAEATGIPLPKLREMAEAQGLIKDEINVVANLQGADQVIQDLSRVGLELEGVPPGKSIEVKAASDEAIAALRAAGWEVEHLPGQKNMTVTASTEAARKGLIDVAIAAANVDNAPADVNVTTNAGLVTAALGVTADQVRQLPNGDIQISDTTDENIARINALTGKVHEPKNGMVTINDADVNRARGNIDTLNNRNTQSRHTVIIGTVNRGGNDASTAGITVGQHYADGGIRSFADGGTLPGQATIERPHGARGLVQWAEAETGGEAFIPLAPAKRKRSLSIWAEVGKRLGALDPRKGDAGPILSFAEGGIMASGLIDFAKGVEGAPYVWGGVQWGDCSGAVSALANYVSGRSPFGSRFATASQREGLAERGFLPGRGGAGDLRVGWVNGGPGGGHTAATLPNGTNFEMGGGRGNGQYGGSAAGADDPQFTDHAYFPMERFSDIDLALGADVEGQLAQLLGMGNPDMADTAPDNRTPREKNIDAIVAEGKRRGMSDRDIQIALMTAEQESGIRVLANNADPASLNMPNEGVGADHDSTGIFQQRNNGAWGTLEDRMDPTKSAGMFYDELAKVQNRESLSLAAAAQAVQKSAYPDAYAKHEAKAASELSASKARIESMGSGTSGATAGGQGVPVYVTNMPAGGFTGGGGGGGVSSGGGDPLGGTGQEIVKPGSLAHFLMTAAGVDQESLFGGGAAGATGLADATPIIEKSGDIEAAREQARIAQMKLDELNNKTNAKGEKVAPAESALAAAELRVQEANRKIEKLEHDLRELREKAQLSGVQRFANGGFSGLENHTAQIVPGGSWRVWGEPETGGEAYIPLASHKRARSTAILAETAKRFGYKLGAGVNLAGSMLLGGGLDTGWGGPSLAEIGIDAGALQEAVSPGVTAEAERAGQQIAAILAQLGAAVDQTVEGTLSQVNQGQSQLRQAFAGALI